MVRQSLVVLVCLAALAPRATVSGQAPATANPSLPGWYADPEAHIFGDRYWIYPTYSMPYDRQTFMDAFSSSDLVVWTKHPRVLDVANVRWATRALWAPSVVGKEGWGYLRYPRRAPGGARPHHPARAPRP